MVTTLPQNEELHNSAIGDLKKVGTLYKALCSSLALVPGVSIMLLGIATPPGISKFLFGGLIEVFGVIAIIIVLVNRHVFAKYSKKKITKIAMWLSLLCFVAISTYYLLYNFTVVDHPLYKPFLFPLFNSGTLETTLESVHGDKYEAVERYGYQGVYDMINSSSKTGETLTFILMILTYNIIFIPLITIFGILGFHLSLRHAS